MPSNLGLLPAISMASDGDAILKLRPSWTQVVLGLATGTEERHDPPRQDYNEPWIPGLPMIRRDLADSQELHLRSLLSLESYG